MRKDEEGHLNHPEFSDAIKKAKTSQEHCLVTNGLRGNFDKTFSIFFAKNVLGWEDVQHVEQNSTVSYNDLGSDQTNAPSVAEAKRLAEES
ncbi:MAG: hypothetical protein KF777_18175 [Planctomycetaceae bacterium]|nr:hypothetical protein [Planctomycetaceae bacterium]